MPKHSLKPIHENPPPLEDRVYIEGSTVALYANGEIDGLRLQLGLASLDFFISRVLLIRVEELAPEFLGALEDKIYHFLKIHSHPDVAQRYIASIQKFFAEAQNYPVYQQLLGLYLQGSLQAKLLLNKLINEQLKIDSFGAYKALLALHQGGNQEAIKNITQVIESMRDVAARFRPDKAALQRKSDFVRLLEKIATYPSRVPLMRVALTIPSTRFVLCQTKCAEDQLKPWGDMGYFDQIAATYDGHSKIIFVANLLDSRLYANIPKPVVMGGFTESKLYRISLYIDELMHRATEIVYGNILPSKKNDGHQIDIFQQSVRSDIKVIETWMRLAIEVAIKKQSDRSGKFQLLHHAVRQYLESNAPGKTDALVQRTVLEAVEDTFNIHRFIQKHYHPNHLPIEYFNRLPIEKWGDEVTSLLMPNTYAFYKEVFILDCERWLNSTAKVFTQPVCEAPSFIALLAINYSTTCSVVLPYNFAQMEGVSALEVMRITQIRITKVSQVLPSTLYDRLIMQANDVMAASYEGARQGVIYGSAHVIGSALHLSGITSKNIAHYVSRALSYGGFFSLRLHHHLQQVEDQQPNYVTALSHAANETFSMIAATEISQNISKLLQSGGDKLIQNGWSKIGNGVKRVSALVGSFGLFANVYNHGPVEVCSETVTRIVVQTAIEKTATPIVDRWLGK